jgi:hypothetical protein
MSRLGLFFRMAIGETIFSGLLTEHGPVIEALKKDGTCGTALLGADTRIAQKAPKPNVSFNGSPAPFWCILADRNGGPLILLGDCGAAEIRLLSITFGIPIQANWFRGPDFRDSEAGKAMRAWMKENPELAALYADSCASTAKAAGRVAEAMDQIECVEDTIRPHF